MHRDQFLTQLKTITNIADGWRFINRSRKSAAPSGVRPNQVEFKTHFMQLLKGTALELINQEARNDQRHGVVEVDVEEFDGHLRRLKKNKAAKCDGIEAEALIFADAENMIRIIMSECLDGGRLPEEWREATTFPLHKKGDPSVAANYRGISLVNSGYKL